MYHFLYPVLRVTRNTRGGGVHPLFARARAASAATSSHAVPVAIADRVRRVFPDEVRRAAAVVLVVRSDPRARVRQTVFVSPRDSSRPVDRPVLAGDAVVGPRRALVVARVDRAAVRLPDIVEGLALARTARRRLVILHGRPSRAVATDDGVAEGHPSAKGRAIRRPRRRRTRRAPAPSRRRVRADEAAPRFAVEGGGLAGGKGHPRPILARTGNICAHNPQFYLVWPHTIVARAVTYTDTTHTGVRDTVRRD